MHTLNLPKVVCDLRVHFEGPSLSGVLGQSFTRFYNEAAILMHTSEEADPELRIRVNYFWPLDGIKSLTQALKI